MCGIDITEDCSKKVHNILGLNYENTMDLVGKTFAIEGDYTSQNIFLNNERMLLRSLYGGGHYIPAIFINKVKF